MHFLKAHHELSGSGDFSTEGSRLNQQELHRLHSLLLSLMYSGMISHASGFSRCLFRAEGREASVVGNGCILEPELLMLPGRLVGRTRCQGTAPLGGNFTFLTGISHFRSSTIPTATRSAQGAMPLRMPITKRGKKAASPRC